MPVFEYTALNPQGRPTKGSIDAESIRAARQRLRSQGVFPTDVREGSVTSVRTKDVRQLFQSDRISTGTLAVMTRQLATLTAAGLPLVSALQALPDQTESVVLKRIITNVREAVEEGSSLAKALGRFPKTFPRIYVNMVASGEASGTLDMVLENLADYLEGQVELRRKVQGALFYPILMLVICTLVVIGLVTFVVPQIITIFQKQGTVLPLPTRILIAVSNFFVNDWLLLIAALIGLGIFVRWYYQQPAGRSRVDRLFLKLPIMGPLYTKIATARISLTLGTLLSSGVGLLTALEIVRNIINNVHIARAIEDARDGVREGRSLAKELSKSGLLPSMLSHMVAVGEKSGKLEGMLQKAGKAYETEVNASITGLTSLLEPLMIIGVGGIVLSIVISILMPMVDLIQVVQK